MSIPTEMDQIVAALSRHGISLPDDELEMVRAQVEANGGFVRALMEAPITSAVAPALRPPWGLLETSEWAFTGAQGREGGPVDVSMPGSNPGAGSSFPRRFATPSEAVEAALSRIESLPDNGVFIAVFADQAREEARMLERRAGRSHGVGSGAEIPAELPLWGTTVSVKDLMRIKGYAMTGGTRAITWARADEDAVIVERLRRAGAVVIGAANLHELAFGTTGVNPHFGVAANPAAPGRLPGGSSSGSAASVGFGMATFSIGTDTGGSIRIPAACCGIVGFKPSFGLLPLEGVFPLGYSLDHVGPLTKTVAEAAALMDVLAGRTGAYAAQPDKSLKGVRIGVPRNFYPLAEPEVLDAYEAALQRAQDAGARLVPVSLPTLDLAPAIYLLTSGVEAIAIHYHTVVQHGDKLGRDVRVRLIANLLLPGYARVKAQQLRTVLAREFADAFQRVDVMATPVLPIVPPTVGTATVKIQDVVMATTAALLRNTSPLNLTGLPAVSLPAGTGGDGAPIGLQLAGPYGADARVLKIARAFESNVTGLPPAEGLASG